jgi:hypothetical protein
MKSIFPKIDNYQIKLKSIEFETDVSNPGKWRSQFRFLRKKQAIRWTGGISFVCPQSFGENFVETKNHLKSSECIARDRRVHLDHKSKNDHGHFTFLSI